jgi:deoxycytidine triphosphate deaminase
VILSDREILAAVMRGDIKIRPLPPVGTKLWTSTALDLTLDKEVRVWRAIKGSGQLTPISPILKEFNTEDLILKHT